MKRVSAYIHVFPVTVVLLGIVACIVCVAFAGFGRDFTALLVLISLASLLIGGVLGFLFGIPKLNRAYDPRENYNRSIKYHPNTNLEDVSDWLTKIIIGITLTQITRIPTHLQSIADSILLRVDCTRMNCDFAQPVLISLILYFFIAGFIIGYFYTRLYLPNLFAMMEESRVKDAEIAIWRSGVDYRDEEREMVTDNSLKMELSHSRLSREEKEFLETVKRHGYHLPVTSVLQPEARASLNVLAHKGILKTVRDDDTGSKYVIPAIGEKFLDKLIQQ